MEKDNSYSPSIRKLPDDELFRYIQKPDEYEDEAVIAAIRELQKRGKANRKLDETLALLEEKRLQNEVLQQHITITPSPVEGQNIPVLYSKSAIRLFSILFSTLFGGILLSINLYRINKRKEIFYVISFSLVFSYCIGLLVTYLPEYSSFIAIFMNLLGLIILEGFFWNRFIGNELNYNKQPIWLALGTGLLLAMFLLWNMMK